MQNTKYKITLLFCGMFLLWNMQAQVEKWKNYTAYYQATQVVETPNLVFGVYDGSLLSYDQGDGEIRTYSNQNGLHDADIQFIAYHPATKSLILVYTNANIDIFLGNNDVYNIPFCKTNNAMDKTVYNLEIIGDYAYLSTAFGIVVIDLKRKEIKDTYDLGVAAIRSVCQNGDYLYAATSEGVKKALTTSNLLDRENWKAIDQTDASLSSATQLLFFKDQLFYLTSWNQVIYMDANENLYWLGYANESVRSIKLLNDQLVVATDKNVYFYSDLTNYTGIPLSAYSIDCINSKNQYWLASGEAGLTGLTKSPDSSEYNVTASEIKVNSPKRNWNFYMTFQSGKLLITGGGKDSNRQNIEGTLMVYEDGKWYNFDADSISAQTGLPCLDFVSVTVDPLDPNHYFVGSWGEGLYEFQNNKFDSLYTYENSSLQTIGTPTNPSSKQLIRVDGMVFDKNHNLYMVNASVANGLSIYTDQKTWKNFYYPPLATSDPDRILIDRNNLKWFNFYRSTRAGIMVLDDNGTIDDSSDDKWVYSGTFSDQLGTDVKATSYHTLVEDQNGLIWVGTDNGLIYFTSMDQVGNGVCNRIVLTDQYGNGYYPLEGVFVKAVAVDGGNRKWVGSAGSGVFVIDQSNGSEETTVENFTVDNSPLLSNNVNSIAINNQTGEVFIGTDKGLCSYQSEAIEGKPNYSNVYAYPNPVRPANSSQVVVTGLMQNSTVKITDMTGNYINGGISIGGQYVWNCADRRGTIVKAGIYLVFAATPDGTQGMVTKIMVIR